MAQLTPLSKGLLGLIIVGGMVSVAWNLVLKERVAQFFPGEFSATAKPSQADATVPGNPTPPTGVQPVQPERAVNAAPVSAAPVVAPAAPKAAASRGMTTEQLAEEGRRLAADKDYVRARPLLEAAVSQGSAAAACVLGEMTMKGLGGLKPNNQRAGELFQIAQAQGVLCFGQ